MPIANPLIEGMGPAETHYSGPPDAYEPPPASAPSSPGGVFGSMSLSPKTGGDNIGVAILVGVALLGVFLLKIGGFRFAVDAGVTKL